MRLRSQQFNVESLLPARNTGGMPDLLLLRRFISNCKNLHMRTTFCQIISQIFS